jgi:RNA polymerase sigma factor (sigma-70 family)
LGNRKTPQDWGRVVEQIRNGDPAGEEVLYAELDGGARFFLRRRTGSDDVDDLVHDLFLTVVQAIRAGQLREPERLMGFVRTVLFRSAGRRVMARQAEPVAVQEMDNVLELAPNPEQSAIQRQKIELMREVMRELQPRDVEILSRFYLHDQTEGQIRSEMKLTATQFRLLKSRAKGRFMQLIQQRLQLR